MSGLVGYWVLNEGTGIKVKDLSGNNNDGEITGAIWTPGKDGWALKYTVNTNVITVPRRNSIEPTNDFSLVALTNFIDPAPDNYNVLFAKDKDSHTDPYYSYHFSYAKSSATITLQINVAGVIKYTSFAISISYGKWYFFVVVRKGPNLMIYKDGISLGAPTNVGAGAITYWDTNLLLGKPRNYSAGPLGQLGYALMYNRAISNDEIMWLYREPYALFEPVSVIRIPAFDYSGQKVYPVMQDSTPMMDDGAFAKVLPSSIARGGTQADYNVNLAGIGKRIDKRPRRPY